MRTQSHHYWGDSASRNHYPCGAPHAGIDLTGRSSRQGAARTVGKNQSGYVASIMSRLTELAGRLGDLAKTALSRRVPLPHGFKRGPPG
jgi:hypothetical protein